MKVIDDIARRLFARVLPFVVATMATALYAGAAPSGNLKWDSENCTFSDGLHLYKLVEIPGGTFTMGGNTGDPDVADRELPRHAVELTPYYLGVTEVPQWLWCALMGSNPSKNVGWTLPVERVSWNDCQRFIAEVNKFTGEEFSLPTEAQWEYAARDGKNSSALYAGGADLRQVAWFADNSGGSTHSVGLLTPNAFGLYDMSGNVWEWCRDNFYEGYYGNSPKTDPVNTVALDEDWMVTRGGSVGSSAKFCRVSQRSGCRAGAKEPELGFRLALMKIKPHSATFDNGAVWNMDTKTFTYGSNTYKMVYVEGGSFTMGSTYTKEEDYGKPTHRVTLSSYFIGATEVPQWLWVAVMGSNPSKWQGACLPVERVSWNDCQEFLTRLYQKTGVNFRLPTEAQWEFAARGGNRSKGYEFSGSKKIKDVAWYKDNSGGHTHEVGTKSANELGLCDMNGNVNEWCSDWHYGYGGSSQTNPTGPSYGTHRSRRGGSCGSPARFCGVAIRGWGAPDCRYDDIGFRLGL